MTFRYDNRAGAYVPAIEHDTDAPVVMTNNDLPDGVYFVHRGGLAVPASSGPIPKTRYRESGVRVGVIDDGHAIVLTMKDKVESPVTLLDTPIKAGWRQYVGDAELDLEGEWDTEIIRESAIRHLRPPERDVAPAPTWIPSLGELLMIEKYLNPICDALMALYRPGFVSTFSMAESYWSSTPASARHLWTLNLRTGRVEAKVGDLNTCALRFVSAFPGYDND